MAKMELKTAKPKLDMKAGSRKAPGKKMAK